MVKFREIEENLHKYGSYASTVVGVSMYPMLRPRQDTVFIETAEEGLSAFDVALYHVPGGRYVLHRVLKVQNERYIICGDNCVNLEYVPREWVIGRLTAFYRGEKKVELTDVSYRLYVALWCRPWQVRIFLLKLRRIGGKVWRGLHGSK